MTVPRTENGNDRNLALGATSRSFCFRSFALSLFGRTQGTPQEGFGTERGSHSFRNCHQRNQSHYGNMAYDIREGKAPMIAHDKDLETLAKTFHAAAADATVKMKRLNVILDGLTAETCPLSPCNDCMLIKCMLRREKVN